MVDKTLSHYKILAELGRGGMGIVYKGEDTKLKRTVAIKVLPAAALSSENDHARFYREARAAAALTHPNIAVVYEIDEAVPEGSKDDDLRPFIAMEYIQGDTLEDRIEHGPMKLADAVRIASETAEGLKAAHAKNIVHRDIKAANVMLDGDGRAKILDFGLAQTAQSTKLTRQGSTLGTIAYMSPEQARGEEVDERTDIWALGVVLYEMIAGKHPFGGTYEQAVVYEILNQDPEPLTAVRTGVPMELERIVGKALAKRADQRYQSTTDLLVDLSTLDLAAAVSSHMSSSSIAVNVPVSTGPAASRQLIPILAAVVLTAVVSLIAANVFRTDPAQDNRPFVKLRLKIDGLAEIRYPTFSPDRSSIFFSGWGTTGPPRSYRYDLATNYLVDIGRSVASLISVSPDGEYVAWGGGGINLKKLPFGETERVDGGLFPQWIDNKTILYGTFVDSELRAYDVESQSSRVFVPVDTLHEIGYTRYVYDAIPEHGGMIVGREYRGGRPADLVWFDFASGEETLFWNGGINANLIGNSHLLYQTGADDDPYVIQPFDVETRAMLGSPVEVMEGRHYYYVRAFNSGDVLVAEDLSCEGFSIRTFFADGSSKFPEVTLPTGCYGEAGLIPIAAVSSDGSKVTVSYHESPSVSESDLMVVDLSTGSDRRFQTSTYDGEPIFSQDDDFLYLSTLHSGGGHNIFRRRVDGLGEDELIVENGRAPVLSNDGILLAYNRRVENETELRIRNLQTTEDQMVDHTFADEVPPVISPDGEFVIYLDSGGSHRSLIHIDSGTKTIFPLSGSAEWSADSQSFTLEESGELIRIPFSYSEGAFQFREKEPMPQFEAGDWDGFRVAADGSYVVVRGINPRAGRDHTVLEWWQNFDTQLERISPTPEN